MTTDRLPDEAAGPDPDRRERVVGQVLARIAAAPKVQRLHADGGLLADVSTWAVPTLAAAALIIVASVTLLRLGARDTGRPATLIEALGVRPSLAHYVATGEVDLSALRASRAAP